jgi:hypothetical protein
MKIKDNGWYVHDSRRHLYVFFRDNLPYLCLNNGNSALNISDMKDLLPLSEELEEIKTKCEIRQSSVGFPYFENSLQGSFNFWAVNFCYSWDLDQDVYQLVVLEPKPELYVPEPSWLELL